MPLLIDGTEDCIPHYDELWIVCAYYPQPARNTIDTYVDLKSAKIHFNNIVHYMHNFPGEIADCVLVRSSFVDKHDPNNKDTRTQTICYGSVTGMQTVDFVIDSPHTPYANLRQADRVKKKPTTFIPAAGTTTTQAAQLGNATITINIQNTVGEQALPTDPDAVDFNAMLNEVNDPAVFLQEWDVPADGWNAAAWLNMPTLVFEDVAIQNAVSTIYQELCETLQDQYHYFLDDLEYSEEMAVDCVTSYGANLLALWTYTITNGPELPDPQNPKHVTHSLLYDLDNGPLSPKNTQWEEIPWKPWWKQFFDALPQFLKDCAKSVWTASDGTTDPVPQDFIIATLETTPNFQWNWFGGPFVKWEANNVVVVTSSVFADSHTIEEDPETGEDYYSVVVLNQGGAIMHYYPWQKQTAAMDLVIQHLEEVF